MPAVTTFAPIATQLARMISVDELLPHDAVEQTSQQLHEGTTEAREDEPPDDVHEFESHYFALVRAASELLEAAAFDRLARLQEDIEHEYRPGGPPKSPVYDSFATQFVLSSAPQGIGNETPYSVLARLLIGDAPRGRLQRLAQTMADSRLELYRVKSTEGHDAELLPLRGDGVLRVRLTDSFFRVGDLALVRVLAFDDQLFIADSPYLLNASEDDWLEHLARVVAGKLNTVTASAPQKAKKLSGKEQARRRQREKAKASRNDPEEIVRRYLKLGLSEFYWFDYIRDAYAGDRHGMVFLAGVPDRPEHFPHLAAHGSDSGEEADLTPLAELREELLYIVEQEGVLSRVLLELDQLRGASFETDELSENELNLLAAYSTLGVVSTDGTTALERFERSTTAASLPPEQRAALESLKNGWFSAFRVDRILEEGLEVFDLLREEQLPISEHSATRQVELGDLMLGWVCKDEAGVLTFEGALAHVPYPSAVPIASRVNELRGGLPPLADEQAWKRQAAQLPLPLISAILDLRAHPPRPKAGRKRERSGRKPGESGS